MRGLGEAERFRVRLLPKPKALIETAYNRLARNAIVQQVELALSEWGAEADSFAATQSTEGLAEAAAGMFPYLEESSIFSAVWVYSNDLSKNEYQLAASTVAESLDFEEMDGGIRITLPDGTPREMLPTEMEGTFVYDSYLACLLEEDGHIYGAIAARKVPSAPELTEEDISLLSDVGKQLEQTLSQVAARHMRSEKQKADISVALSTSMGHDLTNMIATTKWDIQTVRMFLKRFLPELGTGRQAKIFGESLQGLLNNMQLLQEVVDLYRSLGLTKKPQYEECDFIGLVEDAVKLFQYSTSRNVLLHTEHRDTPPLVAVEPRLLKVALFNLLSNSAQACANRSVQIGQTASKYVGEIHVTTFLMDQDRVSVEIRDNGTGFLDRSGEKLPGMKISRIFESGYTTKTGRIAGGLGLSWVQTIVAEVHSGRILAENLEPSGARIQLILPIRKAEEAQENEPPAETA